MLILQPVYQIIFVQKICENSKGRCTLACERLLLWAIVEAAQVALFVVGAYVLVADTGTLAFSREQRSSPREARVLVGEQEHFPWLAGLLSNISKMRERRWGSQHWE